LKLSSVLPAQLATAEVTKLVARDAAYSFKQNNISTTIEALKACYGGYDNVTAC
jgi:hypothetical protein